jgi:hypothetical protein
MLLAMDGGSSLKQFTTPGTIANDLWAREFNSNYFLPRAVVDKHANEVVHHVKKSSGKGKRKAEAEVVARQEDIAMEVGEGPAPEVEQELEYIYKAGDIDAASSGLAGLVSICVEWWKANANDSKKGMFSCFDKSGVFISVCRHGFILVVADMVASGEL